MNLNRYKRQMTIPEIGLKGQNKLLNSKVLIVGMGATGSLVSNMLARAGVGYLRIVDQDFVEETNLQRQFLFEEEDVKSELSKVEVSLKKLKKINSKIKIDPHAMTLTNRNIEKLFKDIDIIIDCCDNFETRFLMNDASVKFKVPFVYGGVIGLTGAVMTFVPGKNNPCFRCFMDEVPTPGSYDTCTTAGVVSSITGIVSSFQVSEVIKFLVGIKNCDKYLAIDLLENYIEFIEIDKNKKCETCVKKNFEFLENKKEKVSISLCGHNAYQFIPNNQGKIDLKSLSVKLKKIGEVRVSKFMLSFKDKKTSFKIFNDSRAIIEKVKNEGEAKKIYEEYIGL